MYQPLTRMNMSHLWTFGEVTFRKKKKRYQALSSPWNVAMAMLPWPCCAPKPSEPNPWPPAQKERVQLWESVLSLSPGSTRILQGSEIWNPLNHHKLRPETWKFDTWTWRYARYEQLQNPVLWFLFSITVGETKPNSSTSGQPGQKQQLLFEAQRSLSWM